MFLSRLLGDILSFGQYVVQYWSETEKKKNNIRTKKSNNIRGTREKFQWSKTKSLQRSILEQYRDLVK